METLLVRMENSFLRIIWNFPLGGIIGKEGLIGLIPSKLGPDWRAWYSEKA